MEEKVREMEREIERREKASGRENERERG